MRIEIYTESLLIEQLRIVVNGQRFCLEKETTLTEEEQKEEALRCYGESIEKLRALMRQIKDQGVDVSAQLAELTAGTKGGDV